MNKALSLFVFFAFFSTAIVHGQNSIQEIITESRNFDETIEKAELFFKTKYPNLSAKELCEGEHRDGEYVKYRRWRAFWQDRLNPDGTLGDPSEYFRNTSESSRLTGPYDDIEWNNISYEGFITGQINMGRTTSVAFHPTDENIFYVAGAIGGVWKTIDGGNNYTPIGDELPFLSVSSIVVNQDNPDHIYIAISDHVWYGPPSIGIYKTTNGGSTWEASSLEFSFTENTRINWMIADPNDADRVFVATEDGLFLTEDGFESHAEVSAMSCFDVKFKPNDSNVVYLGGNNGTLYRSDDGGLSFPSSVNLGSGSCLIAVTENNPEKCYVQLGGALYKSSDSGLTFSEGFGTPDNNGQLVFSPTQENTLIGGSFDIHKSDDDGASFYPISHWLGDSGLPLIHVDQRNVFVNPLQDDRIYFCNDGGLYTVNPETEEFVDLSDGLLITQFYDIAVSQSDENVLGGGSQDNGNVSRNSDGEWFEYASTGDGMNQDIDPTNSNIRYWSYQLGGMRRWENGENVGIAPPEQDGTGDWETPYKLDYTNPSHIVCGFDDIYESFDKGDSWSVIGDNLGGANFSQLAIAPSNPNRIYATKGFLLFVKDIFTNEWSNEGIPNSNISDLEVDPVDIDLVYITRAGYSDGNKVYRSYNAGDDWENISGSLPNVSTGAIEIYNLVSGGLFVGTDAGVFYRDDSLDDWVPYGNLPNTRVEDIEIQYSSGKIVVGTHGRGVLEAPLNIGVCENGVNDSDLDGICDEYDICADFDDTLLGSPCDDNNPETNNDVYSDCGVCSGFAPVGITELDKKPIILYPNPSFGIVNFEMDLDSEFEFKIFNLSGKLIRTETISAREKSIDLSELSSGSYVAQIIRDGQMIHSEMIIFE